MMYKGRVKAVCFLNCICDPLSHFRELEKHRESAASDIAKKKQEAESAVSPHSTADGSYCQLFHYSPF